MLVFFPRRHVLNVKAGDLGIPQYLKQTTEALLQIELSEHLPARIFGSLVVGFAFALFQIVKQGFQNLRRGCFTSIIWDNINLKIVSL